MERIKGFLPEGSTRARIRATSRVSRTLQDGSLGDTLGDENLGMVVIDYEGLFFVCDHIHMDNWHHDTVG